MNYKDKIERLENYRDYLCAGNPIYDVEVCRDVFNTAIRAMTMISDNPLVILNFIALDPNLPGWYEVYNYFEGNETLYGYRSMCVRFEKTNTHISRDNTYAVSVIFVSMKENIVYKRSFIINADKINQDVLKNIREYSNTADFMRDLMEC